MGNNIINGTINANTVHIGDNNYYNNSLDFYKGNPKIEFSDLDKQLVELIYENTADDKERMQILESLKNLKDSNTDSDLKKDHFSKIKSFLNGVAIGTISKIAADKLLEYLKNL